MITSSPWRQLTGVETLCLAVSCSESTTRNTSSKLRPVADAVPGGGQHRVRGLAVQPAGGGLVPQHVGRVTGTEGGATGSGLAQGMVGIRDRHQAGGQGESVAPQ